MLAERYYQKEEKPQKDKTNQHNLEHAYPGHYHTDLTNIFLF